MTRRQTDESTPERSRVRRRRSKTAAPKTAAPKRLKKENPISLKRSVDRISEEVTGQVEHLPARAEHAKRVVTRLAKDVSKRASVMVQEHPGRTLVGAFLVGFAIAHVARRA